MTTLLSNPLIHWETTVFSTNEPRYPPWARNRKEYRILAKLSDDRVAKVQKASRAILAAKYGDQDFSHVRYQVEFNATFWHLLARR